MANYFNQAFGMWMNNLKEKFNWLQKVVSVIQEQNAACEDVKLKLQEQLRTLQESLVFKWFSRLFPEAPRFGDCHAVASQDGFLGTPEMEAVISDNLNLLDGLELETDYLDGIIPVENPEEKSKLEGQLNELRGVVDEMIAQKEKQENLKTQKDTEYQNLLIECAEKDLQRNEQEKLMQNLKAENEKITKMQDEKTELLNQVRNEMEELKTEKEKEIIEKTSDYQKLEEQEKLLKTLKDENEEITKMQDEKTELLNQLKNKMEELKAEKEKEII
ncbi:uncharacterized protein [Palaemon carinicauda]|uniref:uncharacterized protein n=1 Tax=Palaemon carinicauda TaxID=392227 RepID=UPI0035B60A6B